MAEAFLQVLIKNLASLIEAEIGLIMGVDKEMKKLSNTLIAIEKVLEDAEDKQFQSKAIQNWLSKLNEIAFEIEDILDECVTQVSKLRNAKGISRINFVKKFLNKRKFGKRIKEVAEKLDAIAADRHNFNLCESQFVAKSSQVDWGREMGCVVNEPDHIYGRDEDIEEIVDVLLDQVPNSDKHLSVLPIIGVGGLGKTTLAQLVYNDKRVTHHFDTKLWVTVSDNFDLKTLVEQIIESATGKAPKSKHLDTLQSHLQQVLNGKKYLLVLDDVWNENQEAWVKLRGMLLCGSKGSSIVVTTRLQKVGDIMRTLPTYWLKELLEEQCWLLFKLRAFGQENEQHYPNLEAIGRQIVKKCAGVPLAAKALGGLLRFKREEKEWIRVKESEIWDLPEEEENSILPVLRLSYCYLPVVLKRCFVYCAVFQKDSVIDKQDLIFRWMAHGCISSKGKQEVEDVGDQVWKELVLRSLFQEVDTSEGETTFKMHDLVHDLAQSIMENKIPGAEMKGSNASASNSKIRGVHYDRYSYLQTSSSSITLQVSTLTTIMNYNRLRILKLRYWEKKELPSVIGKLKHLRCLDLSDSSIHSLPQTLCGLWNLQILILTGCRSLKSLPMNIKCMTNLRHIILEGCSSLSNMPSRIRELVSLKTLNLFIVGDKIGNQLDELEHLNLGGTLQIQNLERVRNHSNAKKANLVEKPNLQKLMLDWGGERTSSVLAEMRDSEKVLEALEPHVNLKTLKIFGFKGGQISLWMTKMKHLTEISIVRCPHCSYLPPLGGLPYLQSLILSDLAALEYINGEDEIGVENSVFPSLEHLQLSKLPNLKGLKKEPEDQIMFPNLQTLNISNCELLILSSLLLFGLQKLYVKKCSLLTMSSFSNCKIENLSYLCLGFDNNNFTRRIWNIPEDALDGFSNLKELRIEKARQQQRLPEKWFEGLKSLTKLELYDCKIGSCFPKGWLRHLTALEELIIWSCSELVEMGEEIRYLHLLKKLNLDDVDEMVSLPQGLQHIPTLQSLTLWGLHELTSLPDWLGNLTSLTHLDIRSCPKVPSVPSSIKGITSLKYLRIWGCPELKMLCEKEKGEDWHIIAHIPQISLEGINPHSEAFLQDQSKNLAFLIQEEIGLIMGVDKEMKKLSNILITIQTVWEDAEEKQFQSKAIQNWMSKLNDIAYEIEDILDEYATEISKLKKPKGSSRFNFVKKKLYDHKIGRMKEVAEKLDAIAADRHNFHLCKSQFIVKSSKVD